MFAPSMPYQVSRTDTGQFVFIDPASETVVIDDELAAGFAKLDKILADKPRPPAPAIGPNSSPFTARGARYTPMLLALVLPFVWLLALYLALAHLLSQHSLTLEQAKDSQAEIDALRQELQALRGEVSGAPRSAKTKAKPKPKTDEPSESPAATEPASAPTPAPPTVPSEPPAVANPDATKSPTGGPN